MASSFRSSELTWLRRSCLLCRRLRLLVLRDPVSNEGGVVPDEADQRRAARVLPGEPEEVEAGNVGDAAAMGGATLLVEDRNVDPGVVGPVARRPYDGLDLELAVVFEA